jgi:hypothetical protein
MRTATWNSLAIAAGLFFLSAVAVAGGRGYGGLWYICVVGAVWFLFAAVCFQIAALGRTKVDDTGEVDTEDAD